MKYRQAQITRLTVHYGTRCCTLVHGVVYPHFQIRKPRVMPTAQQESHEPHSQRPSVPKQAENALVRWSSTLPRLHQKHARASGASSGGSFSMMIPSPSAEASTPGSRTQRWPIRRGDFVSVGYGQSQWALKSGMVGEPSQYRHQQLGGAARAGAQPHPMRGTTSEASKAQSWPPQRLHLRPRPQ